MCVRVGLYAFGKVINGFQDESMLIVGFEID